LGDQIKEGEIAGNVARIGEIRNANNIFIGKSEAKKPLGRHRRK